MDEHHGFVVKIFPFDLPFTGETMSSGQGKHLLRFLHKNGIEIRRPNGRPKQAGIEFVRAQAPQLLGAGEIEELVRAQKVGGDKCQPLEHKGHDSTQGEGADSSNGLSALTAGERDDPRDGDGAGDPDERGDVTLRHLWLLRVQLMSVGKKTCQARADFAVKLNST